MTAALRRLACPSLAAPMATGDGLLVRFSPASGCLTPAELLWIADAARRFGSGMIEVTSRGSIQLRGLTASSAAALSAAFATSGVAIRTGVPVETPPLAGLDPTELADPRPLADAIRKGIDAMGLASRLGPKVSVVVDGGGRLNLSGIIGDVRLDAESTGRWAVSIGGTRANSRFVATLDNNRAAQFALDLLSGIAAKGRTARAKDIAITDLILVSEGAKNPDPAASLSSPVGPHALRGCHAHGIAPAFGQCEATQLSGLADAANALGLSQARPAADRALLFVGTDDAALGRLAGTASGLGFIVRPDDPRLAIAACAGAPACASGHLEARRIGAEIANRDAELLTASGGIHVSGCEKRCAAPAGARLEVVGTSVGAEFRQPGSAALLARVANADVAAAFRRVATALADQNQPA